MIKFGVRESNLITKEELEEEEKDQISDLDISVNADNDRLGVPQFRRLTALRR